MNWWSSYKRAIMGNLIPPDQNEPERLPYWRNYLFAQTIIYFIPLSTLALIPGVWAGFTFDLPVVAYADMLAFISLLVIGLVPGVSIAMRKWLFILNLYILALVLLLYIGTAGPGLVYLYAICVIALLIFSRSHTYTWSTINLVICLLIVLVVKYDFLPDERVSDLHLVTWSAVSANLVFLCFLTSILISYLLGQLDRSLHNVQMLNYRNIKTIDELESKHEELEQFTAFASHNLQEPVRMIKSFITLLQRKYGTQLDSKGQQYIHFTLDATERMKRNILSLLEFSKLDGEPVKKEQIDLNEVISEVLLALKRQIQQSNAHIESEPLPQLFSWRVLHFQVLFSLVSNALKYRDKERPLQVSINAVENPSEYIFSVSDNGIGIPEEQFEKIFIIFHRLHIHDDYPGTGLGLSIVQKAVNKWSGRVWVQSKSNEGSTFYYSFPKEHVYEES